MIGLLTGLLEFISHYTCNVSMLLLMINKIIKTFVYDKFICNIILYYVIVHILRTIYPNYIVEIL